MYRTVFTPTEADNMIPFNIPREWYGRDIEVILFPLDTSKTQYPEQVILKPDDNLQNAITAEELLKRVHEDIHNKFTTRI